MRSQCKAISPAVALAAMTACDAPDLDSRTTDETSPDQGAPVENFDPSSTSQASDTMIYEDANDFTVLHDTLNLRPPDMDENDYRRLVQQRDREELQQLLPDASLPTPADLDLLALRWFVQGVGCIAQNHAERPFNVAVHFSSSTDECNFTVPWKPVAPNASAIFTPHTSSDCPADRAVVTINDEYGFFLDTVIVEPPKNAR